MWARRLVAVVGVGASLVAPAGALGANGLDPAFGRGGVVRLNPADVGLPLALAPRRDGSVAVLSTGNPPPAVLALNSRGAFNRGFGSGGIWTSEGEGFTANPSYIAGQPNGRHVVVGTTYSGGEFVSTEVSLSVVQLKRNGTLDRTFGDHGVYRELMQGQGLPADVIGVMLGSHGQILVAYYAEQRLVVVALRANGRLDRSFGSGGRTELPIPHYANGVTARRVRGGAVTIVGSRGGFRGSDLILARLKATGKPDRRVGGDGVVLTAEPPGHTRTSATIDSAGRALIGAVVGNSRSIYRVLPNGGMDRDFGRDGLIVTRKVPYPFTLLSAPDGSIYGAGGTDRGFLVARFGPTGRHEWSARSPQLLRGSERGVGVNALSFAHGRLFVAGGTYAPRPGDPEDEDMLTAGIVVRMLPPKRAG